MPIVGIRGPSPRMTGTRCGLREDPWFFAVSLLWRRRLDNRHRLRYVSKISLVRGTHSGCDLKCGAGAVLPRGLATRAGAAPGIIPFGTTAEAWGAATELGQDRAGNARLIPSPGKHGLELSRDGSPGESRGRSAGRRARPDMARSRAADELRKFACTCLRSAAHGWHAPFGASPPSCCGRRIYFRASS